jgi:XTP/dITP diphosphohydrolase
VTLVVGTTNPGKLREIAAICRPFDFEIEALRLDVPETEDTFEGNALLKARAYAAARPGQVVLVEDSGLDIPALGGLPGPWSANFNDFDTRTRTLRDSGMTREQLDPLNNARVLRMMQDVPFVDRGASFIIVMLVARDTEILFRTERRSQGWIAHEPSGTNGFGYDPIFVGADTFGKTYAELDAARKNLRSHRRNALRDLSTWIAGFLGAGEMI